MVPPPPRPSASYALEIERGTREEVTAKSVVGASIRVAVAEAGAAGTVSAGEHWRVPVKNIVDAKAEVIVIADRKRAGQVKVILSLHARQDRRHSRRAEG